MVFHCQKLMESLGLASGNNFHEKSMDTGQKECAETISIKKMERSY